MKKFYWSGYSNKERMDTISEIEGIVNRHGFIIDFKHYSDLSLILIVEVVEMKLTLLFEDLSKCIRMDDSKNNQEPTNRECLVYLNITFTGSGKIKSQVPAVPG